MNYCLSLDVAKGKSMACMTSKDGEIILKPKEYEHRESALEELYRLSEAISPDYVVFMETTGVYHLQPERFFKEKGKQVIVANALLVSLSKSTLRKTKTDKKDCYRLAKLFFVNEVEYHEISKKDLYANLKVNIFRYMLM